MHYVFKTPCYPKPGDNINTPGFEMAVPTDEGGEVKLLMGFKQVAGIAAVMLQMMKEDPMLAAEARRQAKIVKRT